MATLIDWLPRVGALLVLIIGVVGFFKPRVFTEPLQIGMGSAMAASEIRTVFGALNLGSGGMALLLHDPLVYITLGVAWFCGLLARLYAIRADGATLGESLPGITVDATLAFLFLSGLIFQ